MDAVEGYNLSKNSRSLLGSWKNVYTFNPYDLIPIIMYMVYIHDYRH